MNKYYLILFLTILSVGIRGQIVPYRRVEVKIPENVKVPKNVKDELVKYLYEYDGVLGDNRLAVYNIENKKDTKYKDGVYEFYHLGSNGPPSLFVNYKGRIKIFGTLFIDKFLAEYLEYIKSEKLPVELKLKYLRIIIPYIEKEVKVEKRRYEGK